MADGTLLMLLGFAVGAFVGYKLAQGPGNKNSVRGEPKKGFLPPPGFLRPKSWDKNNDESKNSSDSGRTSKDSEKPF